MYSVYRHTTPSGRVYIGITRQRPEARWQRGWGYYTNLVFFRAINKYGWDNIKHEVLMEGLTENEAKQAEIELIAKHNATDRRYGYNITTGGDSAISRSHTDEEKQRFHEAWLGSKNPNARAVICLETLKVYETVTEATTENGASKVSDCCHRAYKHRTSGGYHWAYYDESLPMSHYAALLDKYVEEESAPRGPMSEDARRKLVERCAVSVRCVETGVVYGSMEEAVQATGVSKANICACCKGRRHTAGGFHWEYVDKEVA